MKYILRSLSILIVLMMHSAYAQVESNFSAGGGIKIGTSSSTCDITIEGAVHYNDTDSLMEFCDGSDWRQLLTTSGSATPPAPALGDGYFVLTSGTWAGQNIQTAAGESDGLDAGNALCLSDLTANDWLGKADATTRGLLDATHVQAFLCGDAGCNSAQASTTYFFARSGDAAVGGASFTTDTGGLGPNNQISWAATNYFNGSYSYYTGRNSNGNDDHWETTVWGGRTCDDWTTGGGNYPIGGLSSTSDDDRWELSTSDRCTSAHRLICFVHPFP